MSSDTNETIADIVAEMRRFGLQAATVDFEQISPESVLYYADRIEAAAERDAAIHAMTCEANERLREHLEIALDSKPGDAATLRAALEEQLRYWNAHIRTRDEEEMRKRTEAALAAPARNCDEYGKRDVVEAFIRDTADGMLDPDAASAKDVDEYMREHWFLFKIWLFGKAEGVSE